MQVQTCKHLSHSFFPTHAFHASRPCLSTFENMLFLPIEHALLAPWRGLSPTHLITFWFHVVYELHNRRLYTPILRIISSLPCSDFSHTSSSLSSAVTLCVIGWLNVSVDLGEFRYSVQLCERKNARGSLGVSSLTDFHRWTEAFLRTGKPQTSASRRQMAQNVIATFSYNVLWYLYAGGVLWNRNMRQKVLLNLWVLWEKGISFCERKDSPANLIGLISSRGCVLFLTENTEEQNTQSFTETLSQPISQNLTAVFGSNVLWILYAGGLLWARNCAPKSSVNSVHSVREKTPQRERKPSTKYASRPIGVTSHTNYHLAPPPSPPPKGRGVITEIPL